MQLGHALFQPILNILLLFLVDSSSQLLPPQNRCRSLKDLRVSVPPAIRKGETAVLLCDFDLEGDSLYSVKWYMGQREFYRFTPKDEFPIKIFPLERIPIERLIDKSKSNMTQLTLVRVDPSMSGVYNCEVSAESPSFHTELKFGEMKVVEVPYQNPRITGLKTKYSVGETLEATCTSGASRPAANLTWFINGDKVHKDHVLVSNATKDGRDLAVAKSRLRTVVKTHSFVNGRIKFRCLASIHNVYNQTIEQEVAEDRPRGNQESTQKVALPSNFLEKTENGRGNAKHEIEVFESSGSGMTPLEDVLVPVLLLLHLALALLR